MIGAVKRIGNVVARVISSVDGATLTCSCGKWYCTGCACSLRMKYAAAKLGNASPRMASCITAMMNTCFARFGVTGLAGAPMEPVSNFGAPVKTGGML